MPTHTYSHGGYTIAYTGQGAGDPLVLLHGNTGGSRMLETEAGFYSSGFRVLAVDLIGHGASPRLADWPTDFWCANAKLILALCVRLELKPVHVIGTSGGAIVALGMAMEAPAQVRSVIADSFVGGRLLPERAAAIACERRAAKDGPARQFWSAIHGEDWESVVDADTQMLRRFAAGDGRFFPGGLSAVRCPVLLTASLEDELIGDAREITAGLAREIPHAEAEIFATGGHPAMLSNTEAFRARAIRFLERVP